MSGSESTSWKLGRTLLNRRRLSRELASLSRTVDLRTCGYIRSDHLTSRVACASMEVPNSRYYLALWKSCRSILKAQGQRLARPGLRRTEHSRFPVSYRENINCACRTSLGPAPTSGTSPTRQT